MASSLANAAARRLHRADDLAKERGGDLRALFDRIADAAAEAYPEVCLESLKHWYGKLHDATIDYGVTDVVFDNAALVADGRIMPLLKELGRPAKQLRRAYRERPDETLTMVVQEGIADFLVKWQ